MQADFLLMLPAILIAGYQLYLWRKLPEYNKEDTELPGSYEEYEYAWFRNGKYACYLLFWAQFFFVIFPITQNAILLWILKGVGYIFVLIGFFISKKAIIALGNNWSGMVDYRIKKGQTLQAHSIYQYLRHPIYAAVIYEIVGYQLIVNSWLVAPLCLFSVFIFTMHIQKEDALLERKFGDEFKKYKQTVKAFIPFVY
jgi:protein-S-isoprenylcysteine O-methyltransferase Ste14